MKSKVNKGQSIASEIKSLLPLSLLALSVILMSYHVPGGFIARWVIFVTWPVVCIKSIVFITAYSVGRNPFDWMTQQGTKSDGK